MTVTLRDLDYDLTGPSLDNEGVYHLDFLCPKCREHEISIAIWSKPPGEHWTGETINGEDVYERVWQYKLPGSDWANLSIVPSIDCTPQGWDCGGWHGHVTEGRVHD